jgi:serine protease Do
MLFHWSIKKHENKKTFLWGVGFLCLVVALGFTSGLFKTPLLSEASNLESVSPASAQKISFSLSSGTQDIFNFNQHLIDIAKKVKPAVVNISIIGTHEQEIPFSQSPFFDDPFFRRFFGDPFQQPKQPLPKRREEGMGSGVIISADGYIVTNNHVVEAGDEIQVVLGNKRKFEAKLIGTDPKTDLAIIKIEATDLPFLTWGDSTHLQVGEMVIAVGNPFGLNQTVTMGIISAVGRAHVGIVDYEDFIQTDAAINPGNSGGALVNLQGELIGINTAIFTRSGGYMGIGFAIPSNMAKTVANSLKEHGKVVRGWLGVSIQEVSHELADQFDAPDTDGALVSDVVKDSPAEEAQFQRGDIIREFDGRLIKNPTKLRGYVAETLPGTKVEVQVLRDGQSKTLTVEIGEMPKHLASSGTRRTVGEDHALSGLTLKPVPPDQAYGDKGVLVSGVDRESRAARAGIRKGDIILEINRTPIRDMADFDQVTNQLDADDSVLILLRRGNATIFLSISGK